MVNCQDFDKEQLGNVLISHGYDELKAMMLSKFNLDLDAIKNGDPQYIALMKDAAKRLKWLARNFDKIYDMIDDIITGQVGWTQLQARLIERGAEGAIDIEEATGKMMVARLKWIAAQEKEGIKFNEKEQLTKNEVDNFRALSQHRITTALQVSATELANEMAKIDAAPNKALAAKADAEARKESEDRFASALNYGNYPVGIGSAQGEIPVWEPVRMGHAIDVKVNSSSSQPVSRPSQSQSPMRSLAAGIGGAVTFTKNLQNGIKRVNKWMNGGSHGGNS